MLFAKVSALILSVVSLLNPYTDNIKELKQLNDKLNQQITELSFGADNTKYLAGQRYRLAGSGIGISDTSVTLQSFTLPVSDTEITMDDFGSIGYATLEPNTSKKEFISFTGVTQSGSDTTATLTGVTRGLKFNAPYDQDTTLRQSHFGSSILIISNPPQLYNRLTAKDNEETITAIWTFASTTMPQLDSYLAATTTTQFVTKKYVDDTAIAGAPDATDSVKGIVEIATNDEITNATSFGSTGARLAVAADTLGVLASTTPSADRLVKSLGTGKVDQGWLDLTAPFSWSGLNSFSATTTQATTTVTGLATNNTLGVATSTVQSNVKMGVSGDVVIYGGLGIGTATTTDGNLLVSGTASTTNMTIAGVCSGCGWNMASTSYMGVSSGSSSITQEPNATHAVLRYEINNGDHRIGTMAFVYRNETGPSILPLGLTSILLSLNFSTDTAEYTVTWSGDTLTFTEDADSNTNGTLGAWIFWFK